MENHDVLITFGGEVKSLGGGRFGGYAIVFGDEAKTDLSPHRDFMTAETDFWVDDDEWGQVKSPIIYNHGLDPVLKSVRLGNTTYTKRDAGIWAEGQLRLREAYETKFSEHLAHIEGMIAAKKLGLSTGVPGHLVEREKRGEGNWLKSWPVGRSELSLTPTPAEPRTLAVTLKSLLNESPDGLVSGPSLVERSERVVAALDEIVPLWERAQAARASEGRGLNPDKRDALKALDDRLGRLMVAIGLRLDPALVNAARADLAGLLGK